jgi:hypothetical protein
MNRMHAAHVFNIINKFENGPTPFPYGKYLHLLYICQVAGKMVGKMFPSDKRLHLLYIFVAGKMVVYMENMVCLASILIILSVSFERYYAVCYPLKMYLTESRKKVRNPGIT